jgi:YidC/Oxa1 family membrane protein insertase
MDSARFALAIVLVIAVIVVTNLLFPPAARQRAVKRDSTHATTPAVPAAPGATTAAGTATAGTTTPAPGAAATAPALAAAPSTLVESPLYRFAVSNAGGALVSAELLPYRSFTRRGPVQLAPLGLGPLIGYRVRVGSATVDLATLPFHAEPAGDLVLAKGSGPRTLRLVHQDSALQATLEYTFSPDAYAVEVRGTITATGGATQLLLDLPRSLAVNEANPAEDYRTLDYVVNSDRDGISSVPLDKVKEERIEEGPLSWVAVKNKYFLVAAVEDSGKSASPFGGLVARDAAARHAALLTATLPIAQDGSFRYHLYLGPQETKRLAALGHDLQDVNPYGWRFLRPIIRPLAHLIIWAVQGMHEVLHLGYGWVLILFGVLIRVLLWPLNAKAMRSQLRNMELQPKLKEIQDRLKNDPERMQKEVMRLYKEEGFNPLGGCLPMLIPMPVLFTLYFVFQATIEFRGVSFLWLPDLSRHDPLYILPVLLGVTMFLLQWLGMRSTPQPNQQMKIMTYFMPAFWVFLFLNFASGLNLYYVSQNIASLPQQLQLLNERKRWQASRAAQPPATTAGKARRP